MGADFHTHFPGHGNDGIRFIKTEPAFLRLCGFVFHFVFSRQAVEMLQKQAVMRADLPR